MAKISTRAPATKVGDSLFKLSWSGSEIKRKITGETRDYWLLDGDRVNKKNLQQKQGKYSPEHWYSKHGLVECRWLERNARNISVAVSCVCDVKLLRTIAGLVGCKVIE